MEVEDAARRWARIWAAGWERHDVDSIAALYAHGAGFRTGPDRDRKIGPNGVREYCEWAFSDESAARCWFPDPLTSGDRASASWWAISTNLDGNAVTLVGISRIRFDADGLVADQQDLWTQFDGAREPYDGWDA